MFGDIFKKKKTEYLKMPFYILRDNPETLQRHKEILINRILTKTGSDKYVEIFSLSFDILAKEYIEYDGASGDNEFDIITENGIQYRYDISAIVHDAAAVAKYDTTLYKMTKSNVLFKDMNDALCYSSLNTFKRNLVALKFVSWIRIQFRKLGNISLSANEYTQEYAIAINKLL